MDFSNAQQTVMEKLDKALRVHVREGQANGDLNTTILGKEPMQNRILSPALETGKAD